MEGFTAIGYRDFIYVSYQIKMSPFSKQKQQNWTNSRFYVYANLVKYKKNN